MQRVSGLYGNGVLTDDPTDRAAAANQRMATDVWSAKQGYEWGKEARGHAREDALARLALMREQMGQQADLTREGWGREDARSKSYYDYMAGRDKTLDARMGQQRQWMLEDEARQRGYDQPRLDLETQRLKAEMELFGVQMADIKDAMGRRSAATNRLNAGGGALANLSPEEQAAIDLAVANGTPQAQAVNAVREQRTQGILEDTQLDPVSQGKVADADTSREWWNPNRWTWVGGEGKNDIGEANAIAAPIIQRLSGAKAALKANGVSGPALQAKMAELVDQLVPDNGENTALRQQIMAGVGLRGATALAAPTRTPTTPDLTAASRMGY